MICSKKTIPSQLHTRNLCIFVAYINELASIRKEKSFENLRFQKQNSTRNGENQRQTFRVIG